MLSCRRSHHLDVDEALVLDMGQYELPAGMPVDKKAAAATPPNLAGGCVKA